MTTRMLCSISNTPHWNSLGDALDQPHELVALGIREPRGGLVQKHEAWGHSERAADPD